MCVYSVYIIGSSFGWLALSMGQFAHLFGFCSNKLLFSCIMGLVFCLKYPYDCVIITVYFI